MVIAVHGHYHAIGVTKRKNTRENFRFRTNKIFECLYYVPGHSPGLGNWLNNVLSHLNQSRDSFSSFEIMFSLEKSMKFIESRWISLSELYKRKSQPLTSLPRVPGSQTGTPAPLWWPAVDVPTDKCRQPWSKYFSACIFRKSMKFAWQSREDFSIRNKWK